jgi:iron complex transport system substrate-binding protein
VSRIRLVATLLALATTLALGAEPLAAQERPLFPVTIRAANGSVTITKKPVRIVSLSPTSTETLYAIGAGRQVIAVDDLSNYPRRAPRTKLSGYQPNVEAIAAYRPDLVVVRSQAGVAELEKLRIKVLQLPEAATLAAAYRQINQLGRATGHPRLGANVVNRMRTRISSSVR